MIRPDRSGMRWRAGLAACALLLAVAVGAGAATGAAPLRVCADPDNLPFTRDDAATRGLYLELLDAVAAVLGTTTETYWWRNIYGAKSIRNTLLANRCDVYPGLPQEDDLVGGKLAFSKPFEQVGYALAYPAGRPVKSFADMRGKRIGVQYASPPQSTLATRDDVQSVTFRHAEEAMQAMADGEIDAAWVWGPSAGWYNRVRLLDRFVLQPVEGVTFPGVMGYRAQDRELRERIDAAIAGLEPELDRLRKKYGFPSGTPIRLAENAAAEPPPAATRTDVPAASATDAAASTAAGPAPAPSTPASATPGPTGTGSPSAGGDAAVGNKTFNNNCSHCHGPDAKSALARTNLRRLKARHGESYADVFNTTVRKGRPAKGMPTWGGVLREEDFADIKAYLDTVQEASD